ncbi:MAG: YraN family protein [Gemmatimonadetes bacterium]|nr:YraN family protein [Gemmatimonadota bacterium]
MPVKPGEPHELGKSGEALAAELLATRAWTILARNYRFGHKEIDLIARQGNVVAFVEVKTRAGRGYGHPLEAVHRLKRREIQTVARSWIARNGRPGDVYRFDAVAVVWEGSGPPVVEHIPDAWRSG